METLHFISNREDPYPFFVDNYIQNFLIKNELNNFLLKNPKFLKYKIKLHFFFIFYEIDLRKYI